MEMETMNVRFAEELVPGSRFYGGKTTPLYTVASVLLMVNDRVMVITTDGKTLAYPAKKALVVMI